MDDDKELTGDSSLLVPSLLGNDLSSNVDNLKKLDFFSDATGVFFLRIKPPSSSVLSFRGIIVTIVSFLPSSTSETVSCSGFLISSSDMARAPVYVQYM